MPATRWPPKFSFVMYTRAHPPANICKLVAISCTFPIIIIELVSVPFIEMPRIKNKINTMLTRGVSEQTFSSLRKKKGFWHLSGGEKRTREQHAIIMYFSTSNYIRCMCLTNERLAQYCYRNLVRWPPHKNDEIALNSTMLLIKVLRTKFY